MILLCRSMTTLVYTCECACIIVCISMLYVQVYVCIDLCVCAWVLVCGCVCGYGCGFGCMHMGITGILGLAMVMANSAVVTSPNEKKKQNCKRNQFHPPMMWRMHMCTIIVCYIRTLLYENRRNAHVHRLVQFVPLLFAS